LFLLAWMLFYRQKFEEVELHIVDLSSLKMTRKGSKRFGVEVLMFCLQNYIIILCVLFAESYVIANPFTDINNEKLGSFFLCCCITTESKFYPPNYVCFCPVRWIQVKSHFYQVSRPETSRGKRAATCFWPLLFSTKYSEI